MPIVSAPSAPEPAVPAAVSLDSALLAAEAALGRAAVAKASWRLLPLIALGYGTAYMDRVNISFASLEMNRDLHFSASIYGLGAGLFFVAYAACEIPSNLLLLRFGARRWLARIMFTWGLLAIGMMFVRTPIQFYVMRFLLGMAEAGFFPGVLFYLMQWFPPGMRARAISRFYISLPLSSVLMGAVAGSLLSLKGHLGLAGWQWLFLVEGLPALALSVAFWRLLPDRPADAAWLTAPEQAWLTEQIAVDARGAGASNKVGHGGGAAAALRDPRVLGLGLIALCMLTCNYAYAFSAPAILMRLTGLSATRTGFLISAINLVAAAAMLLAARRSDRLGERYWHVIVPFAVMAACFIGAGATVVPWLAVPCLAMVVICNSALQGPLLAAPVIFLKGDAAAAGIAAINMIGMSGGFAGPAWMGLARDLTGNYQRGLLTLALPSAAAAAIMWLLRRKAAQAAG